MSTLDQQATTPIGDNSIIDSKITASTFDGTGDRENQYMTVAELL